MSDQTSLDLYEELKNSKYASQLPAIEKSGCGDIDASFLGFVDVYKGLSQAVSKDYIIYDFGCAYNFQNYYFRDHEKYVAINPYDNGHMVFENTEYHEMSGQRFLEKLFDIPNKSFAILSAVPDTVLPVLVKHKFNNCFIWYPI